MMYETLMVGTFLATALPDVMVVVCFSGIGFSHHIFALVARDGSEIFQVLSGCVSLLALLLYIVLDIGKASNKIWLPYALLSFASVLALSISVSLDYSWASPFLCLQSSFVILGYMRNNVFSKVSTKDFFTATALSFSICGSVMLAIWIGWRMSIHFDLFTTEWDHLYAAKNEALTTYLARDLDLVFDYSGHCLGTNQTNNTSYEETVREALGDACERLGNVVQMQQWCPAVVGGIHIMSALCCTFMLQGQASSGKGRVSERAQDGMLSDEEVQAAMRLQAILKRSLLVITGLAAIAYAAASSTKSAAIFTQAFYSFGIGGTVTILGYVYVETDHVLLQRLMTQTRFGKIVLQVFRNEWMRAFLICMFNFSILTLLLVDLLRQKVRRWRDASGSDLEDKFTPMGRMVINELRAWNWSMVLRKVDILSFIGILLFVGLKATYVFFSWLNYFLLASGLNVVGISLLVFAIGFMMFMLPIVPGTAVYLFSGVVLGFYAASRDGDLVTGIAIGVVLTSILKHVACIGQYYIGYLAGKSVHVQRFVGVDKVPTRAMEMILNKRGFALGKVCILVAGPDFPTSVLCGILKLNVPQMLLGTTPVIIVSIIPQVTVGALLTVPGNGGHYSAVATGFAGALQVFATLYVSYRILKTAEENLQDLSQHRAEHEQVAELTRQEASYTRKYLEISSWPELPSFIRTTIVMTSAIFWGATLMLAIDFLSVEKICFQRFSMTDRIEADMASGGLGGNVWNIVKQPLGSIVLGSTLLACLLHIFVGTWLDRVTRRKLQMVDVDSVDETALHSPVPSAPASSARSALAKQAAQPPQIVVRYSEELT